jgi:hypothetical protein
MSTLEQRLTAVADAAANLIAQLYELHQLRDRVRKAELSAWRSQQIDRRKRTRHWIKGAARQGARNS